MNINKIFLQLCETYPLTNAIAIRRARRYGSSNNLRFPAVGDEYSPCRSALSCFFYDMKGSDSIIDHVVEKYSNNRRELFVWNGRHKLQSFWDAECIQDTDRMEGIVSILPTNRPEKALFIGLDTGVIEKVTESGCEEFNRFSSIDDHTDQYRRIEYDNWINGFRSIKSIVRTKEGIFDASAAGLFYTSTGEQIFADYVTSATVYDDRLCVVPMGLTSARDSFAHLQSNGMRQGSLVDAFTGEELVRDFALYDRKTQTQPDYLIVDDKVFVASGKPPNVTVNIKELPSLRPVGECKCKRHVMFVEHEGSVYHLCQTGGSHSCIYGYEEDNIIYESSENEVITSILSSDRLLISVTDLEQGVSRIKDALSGDMLFSEEATDEYPLVKLKLHAICFTW